MSYLVEVHFSATSTQSVEDKLKRVILHDLEHGKQGKSRESDEKWRLRPWQVATGAAGLFIAMFRLGRTRQNAASPGRLRTARERIDFFQSIRPLNALRPMDHTSFIHFFLFFHFSRCAVHFLLYPVYCNAVIHFLSAIRYFLCTRTFCLSWTMLLIHFDGRCCSLSLLWIHYRTWLGICQYFLKFFWYFFIIFSALIYFGNIEWFSCILRNFMICFLFCGAASLLGSYWQ